MSENFSRVSKTDLDREMRRFSLSLYNNRLFSKKAVDDVLKETNQFFCDFYIPFIQTQIYNEFKSFLTPQTYKRLQFILEDSKGIFGEFSTEHRRIEMYARGAIILSQTSYT